MEALAPCFDLEIITLVHNTARLADPGPVATLGTWRPVLAWNQRGPAQRLLGQVDYHIRGRRWERETWYLGTAQVAEEVTKSLARRPADLVHVAYWYTLRHLKQRSRPPLWVLDTHDVQFERWERLRGRVRDEERSAEIEELKRNDVVVAITPHDAGTFRQLLGANRRIETIGMGVDVRRWSREALPRQERSDSIVYYGNMASEMNIQAVRHLCAEILPELRRLRSDVEVVILGADPVPEVRALGKIPEVRVTGTVEDPREVLGSCGVLALCLRAASGIRSRACEAMALEVPTVAYPESLEGMGFEEGRDYLGAKTAREFAEQIDRVLRDHTLAERLSRSARSRVIAEYSYEATYGRFVDLYKSLV